MPRFEENSTLHRIEIHFETIPDVSVRQEMKSKGYRWNSKDKYWYAQTTNERLALAEKLCKKLHVATEHTPEEKEKIIIKIDKLLKLASNNPSSKEARSAKAKAFKLMNEYDIEEDLFKPKDDSANATNTHTNYSTQATYSQNAYQTNQASQTTYQYNAQNSAISNFLIGLKNTILGVFYIFRPLLWREVKAIILASTIYCIISYLFFNSVFNWTYYTFLVSVFLFIANIHIIIAFGFVYLSAVAIIAVLKHLLFK